MPTRLRVRPGPRRSRYPLAEIEERTLLVVLAQNPTVHRSVAGRAILSRLQNPRNVRIAKVLLGIPVRSTIADRRAAKRVRNWAVSGTVYPFRPRRSARTLDDATILAVIAQSSRIPQRFALPIVARLSTERARRVAWLLLGRTVRASPAEREAAAQILEWARDRRGADRLCSSA